MRQQFQCGLAVADEVVVDKIDRAANTAFEQLVELGRNLLRRLDARVTAVEPGNIAKLALIGTSARILNAAQKVAVELGEFIGGKRKACHVETVGRLEYDLILRARDPSRQPPDQFVGRIAQ